MLLRVVFGMCPVLGRVMQLRTFGVRCAVLCFVHISGHMLLRVVFGMCPVLGWVVQLRIFGVRNNNYVWSTYVKGVWLVWCIYS